MKKRKAYEVWKEYDEFIRSLHLKSIEEQEKDSKQRVINYVKKLLIILIASFFTTLTFQFFITPNSLFNSGINGIIQVLTKYYFLKNGIDEKNYTIAYYISVFFVNLFIVSSVHWFHPENLEMNSTAIFYVFFQFIWSNIFKYSSLQNYVFNRFAPETWSKLSNKNQLGLTLPFYITIGIVSSIIHTYGYSLIYQAKSTPGGLEIITSTLAQSEKNDKNKKSKVSIGYFTKMFGIFVVFLITLFNFVVIEDNVNLKRNELVVFINKDQNIYLRRENLDTFLNDWIKMSSKDREEISNLLKKWSGDDSLEEFPSNINKYLNGKQFLLDYYLEQKAKMEKDHDINLINEKIKDLEMNIYKKNVFGYLKYITNDEKLWASLVYIFFSSYLINQIFPKSKVVHLIAKVENKENLNDMLNILKDYDPVYFKVLNNLEEESYILNCTITKWNYQLLSNDLEKLGKVLINAIDESN
jgi:uncharacterized membrane-anchored protein YitT (DUF2179 family)